MQSKPVAVPFLQVVDPPSRLLEEVGPFRVERGRDLASERGYAGERRVGRDQRRRLLARGRIRSSSRSSDSRRSEDRVPD